MGNRDSAPVQDEAACLWYKICFIKNKNKEIEQQLQGLYRRVDFIDIPRQTSTPTTPNPNMSDSKEAENKNNHPAIAKEDYSKYYKSCKDVYVRIYDSNYQEIEQKKDFIFLWHNGIQWIFSNYKALKFYVGIKLGPQWVISPELQTNLAMLSADYPPDIDQVKMQKKVEVCMDLQENTKFKLQILNNYTVNQDPEEIDESVWKNRSEDNLLRKSYISWRENINIFYQRSQILTKEQIREEAIKNDMKMKADKVRKWMKDIDDIRDSIEFSNLLAKYRNISVKYNGWEYNEGGMKTMINIKEYGIFKKESLDRKMDEQLAFDFVRDITLEFHKYYNGLMAELKELDDPKEGQMTMT